MQIGLGGNRLCGVWEDQRGHLQGTYTAEGIKAIADAMRASHSLTECDLRFNNLGKEGWCAIFDALRENPQNSIVKWDLAGQGINAEIAKSLTAYIAVSRSLTQVRAFWSAITLSKHLSHCLVVLWTVDQPRWE